MISSSISAPEAWDILCDFSGSSLGNFPTQIYPELLFFIYFSGNIPGEKSIPTLSCATCNQLYSYKIPFLFSWYRATIPFYFLGIERRYHFYFHGIERRYHFIFLVSSDDTILFSWYRATIPFYFLGIERRYHFYFYGIVHDTIFIFMVWNGLYPLVSVGKAYLY
jgi:hypothetical protein